MLAKYRYTAVGSQPSTAPSLRTESATAPCAPTRLIAASTIRPADSTEPERVRVLRVRLPITRSRAAPSAGPPLMAFTGLIQPRGPLAGQTLQELLSTLLTDGDRRPHHRTDARSVPSARCQPRLEAMTG